MSTGRVDPSPSFRFKVEFRGGPGTSARFTECSGLEFETETLDYPEGGNPYQVHRLPGRVRFGNVVLKRGIAADGERLWQWVKDVAQGRIAPATLTVSLLSPDGRVSRAWTFLDAYPVAWSASGFSANDNAIAIETLTLAHQGLLLNL
jgi:phage tail-like protein